jgi:co-chaperonin GroES (HSP10)
MFNYGSVKQADLHKRQIAIVKLGIGDKVVFHNIKKAETVYKNGEEVALTAQDEIDINNELGL